MWRVYSKEEAIGFLKCRLHDAYLEARGESFIEFLIDKVKYSEKESYTYQELEELELLF